MSESLLDNPAWSALTSEQAVFATGTGNAKRYQAGLLPFAGCSAGGAGTMADLDPFISTGESFFIIGDIPALPPGWVIEHELPCAQMLLQKRLSNSFVVAGEPVKIAELGSPDANEMFDLVTSVQPGYYLRGTSLLGNYFGVRENGRLVAMAGERMRLPGCSELSAICTLPGYTGRGYAQQLIARLCGMHAAAGIVSFLHVSQANQRAIRLYEHMGFALRRSIVFRRVRKG
jgi:ribosomal protein S18 acetylase RimI-like enzyme